MHELSKFVIDEYNQFINDISHHFLTCPNLEETVYKYKNNLHNTINNYRKIDHILKTLGIPCNIKGYSYLKSAISILNAKEYLISDIYKMIAINNETTSFCVERAIRHAIEVGYSRCSIEAINNFFPKTKRERPTNNEYIRTIIKLIN